MDAPNPKVVKKTRPAPPRPQAGEDDLGVSTLPMSRVAKIIKADSEIHACSKEATFLIGIATVRIVFGGRVTSRRRPSRRSDLGCRLT